jgi:hypothetical protein
MLIKALPLECCAMAEAVLRLGHADRQLVKAHHVTSIIRAIR